PGPYAFGPAVTLADVCLVPQVANAKRFKVPLDPFPKIVAAEEACQQLPAFEKARPENQPDAEEGRFPKLPRRGMRRRTPARVTVRPRPNTASRGCSYG